MCDTCPTPLLSFLYIPDLVTDKLQTKTGLKLKREICAENGAY